MKKICFVVQRYYPDLGGTEKLCQDILEYIRENSDYDISVITTPNLDRDRSKYNYKVYECNFNNFHLMKEHFEIFNYDLTIFFCDLNIPYLEAYDTSWSKKNLCVLNLDENIYAIKHYFNQTTNNLKKFDNILTFTKNGVANKFLEENGIKNTYIPNFSRDILKTKIDDKFIKKLNLDINKKNILYNAAFEDRKNQQNILKAISFSKKLRNHNWIFIGATPDQEYLKNCLKIIKENNLENIKMIKSTKNFEIIDQLYQVSDCVVLTSKAEGMPLVLLEALSANKPIISTDVGGVKGVLSEISEVSIIPVIFNIQDLEESVEKQLKINFNYRKVWENNFQKKDICEKYLNLIKEII